MSSKIINFGKKIQIIRQNSGLTIADVYNKTKISKSTLESYEAGQFRPPYKALKKLSELFALSIDFLILGEETKYIKFISMFEQAEKIDKLSSEDRSRIETFIDTFLGGGKEIHHFYDTTEFILSSNFNHNITVLFSHLKLTQKEIGKKIGGLTERQIASYKKNSECSYETLISISKIFNISIHYLITGKRLIYNFENRQFEKYVLSADEYLDFQKFFILMEMMQKIINS